jgi:hypothetical protein
MPPGTLPRKKSQLKAEIRVEESKTKVLPPCYTLGMSPEQGLESLRAKGQIGEKTCLVTTDIGA